MKHSIFLLTCLSLLTGCDMNFFSSGEDLMAKTMRFNLAEDPVVYIAKPTDYFTETNPAKMVFDYGTSLCGVDNAIKVRCWPMNWLDTTIAWQASILDSTMVLWDTSHVRVLSLGTMQTLFSTDSFPDSIADNRTRYSTMMFLSGNTWNIYFENDTSMLVGSDFGLFRLTSGGNLRRFTTMGMDSKIWKNGESIYMMGGNDSLYSLTRDSVRAIQAVEGKIGRWSPFEWNHQLYWFNFRSNYVTIMPSDTLPTYNLPYDRISADVVGNRYYGYAVDDSLLYIAGDDGFGRCVSLAIADKELNRLVHTVLDYGVRLAYARATKIWLRENKQIVFAIRDVTFYPELTVNLRINVVKVKDGLLVAP